MLDGSDLPRFCTAEIVRVLVNVNLPHMDRPLDCVVPGRFINEAEVGRTVRVCFSGTCVDDQIVERTRRDVPNEAAWIESVSLALPVPTPALYEVTHRIATHFLATTLRVLSLAIPPQHARDEKTVVWAYDST